MTHRHIKVYPPISPKTTEGKNQIKIEKVKLTSKQEMRRHRRRPTAEESEEDSDIDDETTMKCVSCKEEYGSCDAGTCRECYEEASETEEELKREIEELKAKVNFLRFWTSLDHPLLLQRSATPCFTDVVLVASGEENGKPAVNPVPVPAHKAVLVSSHFIKVHCIVC